MVDTSPRHSTSEESGRSIEEERVERNAKAALTPRGERGTREGEA